MSDFSVSGIGGRASGSYALRPVFLVGDFDNYTGMVTVTQDIDYLGTLGGRLGHASSNWLLYATASPGRMSRQASTAAIHA